METLSILSFNVVLDLAVAAAALVYFRRLMVQQPVPIAVPVRSSKK